MRRLLLVVMLAFSARAVAAVPALPASPAPAAASPALTATPTPTHPRWYGWQTLALDAAGLTGLALDIRANDPGGIGRLGAIPIASLALGAPIIHAVHHNWGRAAVSLAARVVLPALLSVEMGTKDNDWSVQGSSWGLATGMLVASGIDALMAWETR